jgi:hypothetical protein
MLPHCSHEKLMVDVVKESLDVQIQYPVVSPASLPCYAYRFKRGFSRPVAIGVRIENRFYFRFKVYLDNHLGHPIPYCRDSQHPLASFLLRYCY